MCLFEACSKLQPNKGTMPSYKRKGKLAEEFAERRVHSKVCTVPMAPMGARTAAAAVVLVSAPSNPRTNIKVPGSQSDDSLSLCFDLMFTLSS